MKNPTIATLLNIIPGAGYVYLDGDRKFFGTILLIGMALMLASSLDPLLYSEEYMNAPFRMWDVVSLFSLAALMSAFMYDAYMSAIAQNAALPAQEK
jgi:hypothetical protein